jgi:hypothetical protein
VVIFSAVILGLAGLSFQVAKRSTRATDQALLMSVLLSRVDRASTVAYDSLATIANCDTTSSGVVLIIGCTTVDSLSPRLSSVRIVARTTVPDGRPDTIVMQRGKERRPVPLK